MNPHERRASAATTATSTSSPPNSAILLGSESSAALRATKRGDRDALQFLYVRFAGEVQRYVRSFVGDEHEAEDVTQVVFIKLMSSIGRYEPREVPFSAWLLRVAFVQV